MQWLQVTTEFLCRPEDGSTGRQNVVHSRAVGADDVLHYVFATVGVPAVLVARTGHNASLRVDCERLTSRDVARVNGSVMFSERPRSVYALLINTVSSSWTW